MSNVYGIVTSRVLEMLAKGVVPWRKPWRDGFAGSGPMSLATGRAYRGLNRLMLDPRVTGHSSVCWGTYKQVTERGGYVRKGEKASIAIFWTMLEGKDAKTGERKRVPLLRYYSVFNLDQCEGVSAPAQPEEREFVGIPGAEKIVEGMPNRPSIFENGGGQCYYCPSMDTVHMTKRGAFKSDEGFYATLFHELGHATGHKSRTGRVEKWTSFGTKGYAREELVAELVSAFLCAETGIDGMVIDNSASYIASWMRRLEEDDRALVVAASAAERATDYILGRGQEDEGEEEGSNVLAVAA